MSGIYYVEMAGTLSTGANDFVPMPKFQLKLPSGTGNVLLTLNVPNPYASGNDYPGGYFGIWIDDVLQGPVGCFTYDVVATGAGSRIPVTVVFYFKLDGSTHIVQPVWKGVRESTVYIDSPVSLSAVILP
jgi:hypothetical protein